MLRLRLHSDLPYSISLLYKNGFEHRKKSLPYDNSREKWNRVNLEFYLKKIVSLAIGLDLLFLCYWRDLRIWYRSLIAVWETVPNAICLIELRSPTIGYQILILQIISTRPNKYMIVLHISSNQKRPSVIIQPLDLLIVNIHNLHPSTRNLRKAAKPRIII